MITQIYISIGGDEYEAMDLYKEEAINFKRTAKDLQDLTKIFSAYTLNFSFPATPKNKQIFGFFGETKVVKDANENKFPCKVYTNSVLLFEGIFNLKSIKYKNGTAENIIGDFASSMLDLKTRLGEDLIEDLAIVDIDYTPKKVKELTQGNSSSVFDGVNVSYFVPLVSNDRVWSYSPVNGVVLDNIASTASNTFFTENIIRTRELRPAFSVKSIIELIFKKYALKVECPSLYSSDIKDLYIHGNNKSVRANANEQKLKLSNPFATFVVSGSAPVPFNTTINFANDFLTTNKYVVGIGFTVKEIKLSIILTNIEEHTSTDKETECTFRIKDASNNNIVAVKTEKVKEKTIQADIIIPIGLFLTGYFTYYITIEFNNSVTFFDSNLTIGKKGAFLNVSFDANPELSFHNMNLTNKFYSMDIFKMLPKMKVADFLTSFFKTFNISVFEDYVGDHSMQWLTPKDVRTVGKSYSRATVDYTPYTNISENVKSTSSDYNYFDLKHLKSKYRSNNDYFEQFGVEYGEAVYPAVKPEKAVPFLIQTGFSIVPPVYIAGTLIPTFYGFGKDTPNVIDTGESRYKPNYDEPTLFYSHGIQPLGATFGIQSMNTAGYLFKENISSYIPVLPYNKQNQSLAFSTIIFNNIQYEASLFYQYYTIQIVRMLDPNVLTNTFTCVLPPSEIYVNKSNQNQGGGLTPTGFRLQNEIIIGETLYTILDSTIDITTGKTKLTLLNY